MNVQALLFNTDWWKKEFNENRSAHYAPGAVMGGTTALVMIYWGKYYALGFLTTAILSYPFFHSSIEYLTYLDVHETTFAVAIVAIQFFDLHFPLRLFLSVALAYSLTMRGMKVRDVMRKLNREIQEHMELNKKLEAQITSLDENVKALDAALTKLCKEVLKRETVLSRNGDVVLDMDYSQLKAQMKMLTETFNKWMADKSLADQVAKLDANNQKIAFQTALIEGNNNKIKTLTTTLEEANQKMQALLQRAGTNEALLRNELTAFHKWLLDIRIG
jgi:exonuclease VII small subunit